MPAGASDVVAAALALMAAAQVAVLIVIALSARRLTLELRALHDRVEQTLSRLDTALDRVSAVAGQATAAVDTVTRVSAHVASIGAMVKSLAGTSVGGALLRRAIPQAASGAAGGLAGARFAAEAAGAVWRLIAARRRAQAQGRQPAPPPLPPATALQPQRRAHRTGHAVAATSGTPVPRVGTVRRWQIGHEAPPNTAADGQAAVGG